MILESSYKQLKRYLVSVKGMDSDEAQLCSNKYNRACRTYDKFPLIIKNVSSFPKIDIRDLNINQLHMAVNMAWLHRHNAIQLRMDQSHKDPTDIPALLIGQMLKRQFSFFKLVRGIKKQGRIHLKWRMFLIALPVAQFKMPNNFLGADDVIHNKKKVIFHTS